MEYLRKYWHILAGIICVAVLGGVYFLRDTESPAMHDINRTLITEISEDTDEAVAPLDIPPPAPLDVVVHIEGAVARPGVYTVPYGSRVNDVLLLAGGATGEADLARINLAAFVEDAQQIIIPTEGQELPEGSQAIQPAEADDGQGLININTASASQLTALPGIGPVIAGNIINHRDVNGSFNTVEDLRNVPLIGAVTLDNIRSLITVD